MVRGVGEGAIILKISVWGRRGGDFSREAINRGTVIIRKVTFFLLKATKFVVCSSKNIYTPPPTPTEGTFVLGSPPAPPGGVWHSPSPNPWNFRNFPTWLDTPWKDISVKNAVAKYFMRKIIVSAIKREKIFLFMLIHCQMISILPCSGHREPWRRHGRTRHKWCHFSNQWTSITSFQLKTC